MPPTPPDQRDRQAAYQQKEKAGTLVSPPPTQRSVFSGIGAFSAWDNNALIGLGVKADWCALQLDAEGGGGESVGSLKAAGYKYVHGWQARPDIAGVQKARTLGLDGYIGQAESQAELAACLDLGVLVGMPQALVGNPTGWTPEGHATALKQRWELVLEWYWNVQPWQTQPDSNGYPVASLLLGCYDATAENPPYGRRVPLSDYLTRHPTPDWSVYLAETLSPDDRKVLA